MKVSVTDLDRAQKWRCSPFITREGNYHIDTEQLLATGAMQGPYRRTRPITVTWRMRASRALRSLVLNLRSLR